MPVRGLVSVVLVCNLGTPAVVGVAGGGGGKWCGAYTYNGLLSLDASLYALLLDLDDQVPALEVARNAGDGDIYVGNGLLPLVGEGILLGLLLGAGGCLLGGGGFCEDVSLFVGDKTPT